MSPAVELFLIDGFAFPFAVVHPLSDQMGQDQPAQTPPASSAADEQAGDASVITALAALGYLEAFAFALVFVVVPITQQARDKQAAHTLAPHHLAAGKHA